MAEITDERLGGAKRKVGPVVGYTWRGCQILRSMPRKSIKAATAAQLNQRNKFSLVSTFTSKMKDFVNANYPTIEINNKMQKGREQLSSFLIKEGIVVIDDVPFIDMEKVLLSVGTLPPTVIKKIAPLKTGKLKVLWKNIISSALTKDTDKLTIMAFSEVNDSFVEIADIGKRDDKYAHFDLPARWKVGNVHFWSMWRSVDNTRISSSAYHGIVDLGE